MKSIEWTITDIRILREMSAEGLELFKIAHRLGRSIGGVKAAKARYNIKYNIAARPPKAPPTARAHRYTVVLKTVYDVTSQPPLEVSERRIKVRAAASIAHAIDFKRAGHVYGEGELSIEPDRIAVTYRPEICSPNSYLGSSASLCAERGGI